MQGTTILNKEDLHLLYLKIKEQLILYENERAGRFQQNDKFEFKMCLVKAFPDLFELLHLLHQSNFEADDFFEDSKAILSAM